MRAGAPRCWEGNSRSRRPTITFKSCRSLPIMTVCGVRNSSKFLSHRAMWLGLAPAVNTVLGGNVGNSFSRFAGGCGCLISWFGCNATTRSRRSSRSGRRNKKKHRNRLKPLALCHDFSYGPQGRGYNSSVHHRCLPNKLRVRFTPSILRAGCGMADQNWPADVSDG